MIFRKIHGNQEWKRLCFPFKEVSGRYKKDKVGEKKRKEISR